MENVIAYHNSAQNCPVCNGTGMRRGSRGWGEECYVCDGKGWVIVPQSKTVGFDSNGAS